MSFTQALLCRSPWSQLRGFMWRRRSYDALLFSFSSPRCVSLHTWFVFFPLDIYYLDTSGVVLLRYLHVRPFTCYLRGVPASFILETPQRTSFAVGSCVDIKHIKRLAQSR